MKTRYCIRIHHEKEDEIEHYFEENKISSGYVGNDVWPGLNKMYYADLDQEELLKLKLSIHCFPTLPNIAWSVR